MEVLDYLRTGAVVVAFVATAFGSKQTWYRADMVTMLVLGLSSFFFPHHILEYMTVGKMDWFHIYIAQCVGSLQISSFVASYIGRNSKDDQVAGSLSSSKSIVGVILLLNAYASWTATAGQDNHFSIQAVTFFWLTILLWTIGHFISLFRQKEFKPSTVRMTDKMNCHLFIDGILVLVSGLFLFGFPEFQLRNLNLADVKIDGLHLYGLRNLGLMLFMQSMHAFHAMYFHYDDDKAGHFAGRLAMYAFAFPVLALTQWQKQIMSNSFLYVKVATDLFVVGNALCAYCGNMSYFRRFRRSKTE